MIVKNTYVDIYFFAVLFFLSVKNTSAFSYCVKCFILVWGFISGGDSLKLH